eukprot:gene13558-9707_t
MNSTLDKTKIKPVPAAKTLALINNFIANTTVFFNNFTEVIEDKISTLSNKITDVEILLAVLEAKLNSIPGLDHIEAAKPPPAATSTPAAPQAAPSSSSSSTASAPTPSTPAPAPAQAPAPTTDNSSSSSTETAAAAPEEPPKAPSLADDPDYAPFFRLLKVGVPLFVVQAKASAAGLDPSAFENFNP